MPADGTSLWLDEPYAARPPLDRSIDVDVCIVGAGIGGLGTAWQLAERGVSAVVVEGRQVASGAGGRNGGFLIGGAAAFYNDLRDEVGAAAARRLHAATLEAQAALYAVADEVGATAAFRRVGSLRVAVDEVESQHVRAQHAALREDGFGGELVPTDELPPAVRRPGRVGLFTPEDSAMHPARWLRALAVALERRGVTIYEGTSVDAPLTAATSGSVELQTSGGRIRARRVVVAADGALPILVPRLADRVRSRRLHMVATEPVAGQVVPLPLYMRYGYEYAQQTPDGRIAVGGFSDLDGAEAYTAEEASSLRVHARLERFLRDELGVDAPVSHRWVGVVGYSADARPFVGPLPDDERILALGGYSGTGNCIGFLAGRIVAELLVSGRSDDADLFAVGRHVGNPRWALSLPPDAAEAAAARDGRAPAADRS